MPLTPQKIIEFRYPVAFKYLGETVNVEYRPTAIRNTTQAELERFQQAQKDISPENEAQVLKDYGEWLTRVIAGWDLVESVAVDGTPGPALPITPETIVTLTNECGDFILRVVEAIFADFQAKNATGTVS